MGELIGVLSNPQVWVEIDKVIDLVKKLLNSPKAKNYVVSLPEPKPHSRGEILSTIRLILLEHPDGLQTYEVRKLVEVSLGRKLPRSTVKAMLAGRKEFQRIGRGRYRFLYK